MALSCPTNSFRKKRIWKIIISSLVLAAVLMSLTAYTKADPQDNLEGLEEEQDTIEEKIEDEEEELEKCISQEEKLTEEINQLDKEIEETQKNIEELNQEINYTKEKIEKMELELSKAEQELSQREKLLAKRLRCIYEGGTSHYLEVLFSSTSFSEFLTRFYDLQLIAAEDQELMLAVKDERSRIQETNQKLEDEKIALQGLRREEVQEENELNRTLTSRENKAAQLEKEIKEKEAAIEQMEEESQKINQLIVEAEKEIEKAKAEAKAEAEKTEAESSEENAENNHKTEEEESSSSSSPPDQENENTTEESDHGEGQLLWPIEGLGVGQNVTSGFGYRIHPIYGTQRWHGGIDIGTGGRQLPILAAESGRISLSTYSSGYGNYVVISHGSGVSTLYAHLSQRQVGVGETVSRGQQIGRAGTTGASTGIHLHFEVHDTQRPPVRNYQPHDYRQDPFDYLAN